MALVSSAIDSARHRVEVSSPIVGVLTDLCLRFAAKKGKPATHVCHSIMPALQRIGVNSAELNAAIAGPVPVYLPDRFGAPPVIDDDLPMIWNYARRVLLDQVLTEAVDDAMVFARQRIVAWGQPDPRVWPSHELVVAPPVRRVRNRDAELHSEDGPALEYRDGWQVFMLHNVVAPEALVLRPHAMTDAEIRAVENSEQVRMLGERLGWQRVMEARGVSRVDTWLDPKTKLRYELYAPRAEDRGVYFLKKQSPVTKQGEQPWYFEPVPRTLVSAQAARKWQALAAFVEGDGELAKLVTHCNRNPALVYTWEA